MTQIAQWHAKYMRATIGFMAKQLVPVPTMHLHEAGPAQNMCPGLWLFVDRCWWGAPFGFMLAKRCLVPLRTSYHGGFFEWEC